jgi:thiamine pyrophosphate-dependent acetolactate synthase large subunit-like protein
MPVKPQRVYAELRRALPLDTIVTLDAGAAPAYGYDRLHFDQPRTLLTPLDLGGLGFAYPAALGAKLGRPEAPALAVHESDAARGPKRCEGWTRERSWLQFKD